MSDPKKQSNDKLCKLGIHLHEDALDVSEASWDESLSKVWTDEATGELCASVDRLLFESPLSIAIRFMEPQGFNLNLENLLACIDSMRVGVFAKTVSAKPPSTRETAKKIAPALYLKLPQRNTKGALLGKFYEEIAKYEGELTRLQQYEAQSRRAMHEAVRDESGRSAVLQLQKDNENLRTEIDRLSRKVNHLTSAIESVPLQGKDGALPHGVKVCTVRHVNVSENLVHLKSEAGQYTCPLNQLSGIPAVNSRALSLHEGGILRSVWIMEPAPRSFDFEIAEVLHAESGRIKLRKKDRSEIVINSTSAQNLPARADQILLKLVDGIVIDWSSLDSSITNQLADIVYDEQTMLQLGGRRKRSKSGTKNGKKRERAA